LYRFLQLFLFLVVLGVAYDLHTVRRAGGTWRRLRELSGVSCYTEIVSFLALGVFAIIAMGQQVGTDSGADVAKALVDSVSALFGGR
jgi:hypothetical protein